MYNFEWWIKGIQTGGFHCDEPGPYNHGMQIAMKLIREAIDKGIGVTIWFE